MSAGDIAASRGITSPSQLFSSLQSEESFARSEAAQELCSQVREWASLCSSDPDCKKQVVCLLPSIMRLARSCPFSTIRRHFVDLEQHLKTTAGLSLPLACVSVSKFLPSLGLIPAQNLQPHSSVLPWFEESFLMRGRVSHLDQVMAMLPEFAEAYFQTYSFLMLEDGPLPLLWRSYLAIVASCRFQCDYLVRLMEDEYILNGGNPEWLHGIDYAPKKLRLFLTLNAYMAHRPWLINKAMITDIVKNGVSLSELVHAIMIMAMFHALCGFVHGLGIAPEVDLERCQNGRETEFGAPLSTVDEAVNHPEVVSGSQARPEQKSELTRNLKELLQTNLEALIAENAIDNPFEHAEVSPVLEQYSSRPTGELTSTDSLFSRYLGTVERDLDYEDYDVKSTTYKVFRMQDYNWKDHGFSLVTRYYHGAAALLDTELDLIYNLTDRSLSEEQREIDTGPFRRAIWHYAHRLFGISNDAYNYQEVNIFLNRSIKHFIKKTTCLSSSIEHRDFLNLGYHFRPDECIHITLLAVEGRRQSEILYALHALYAHQKS